ncbi:MAG: hypothetical protein OEW75_02615 [Cyclobacteriaceae bacterium]|nr:hypothetical protein [Cyclobacteriaceae bacterium]
MKTVLKILLLTAINPGFITSFMDSSSYLNAEASFMAFLMALLQALVLYFLITSHAGISKTDMLWKTFLIFYGVTFFQSGIEAYVFLKYMTNNMDAQAIQQMALFGLTTAIVVSPSAVFLFWKEKEKQERNFLPTNVKLKRLSLIALIYVIIYVAFGALVFIPLAGDHFKSYYGELPNVPWMLPFQYVRGFLWAYLGYAALTLISGNRKTQIGVITTIIAIPITSLLFPVNDLMPAPIRLAHFIEVGSSMITFGLICGMFLTKKIKPIPAKS